MIDDLYAGELQRSRRQGVASPIDAWQTACLQHAAVYAEIPAEAGRFATSVGPDGRVCSIDWTAARQRMIAEIEPSGIRIIDRFALTKLVGAPRTWGSALSVAPFDTGPLRAQRA